MSFHRIHSGHLYKVSRKNAERSKKYYFVLFEDRLCYYKSVTDKSEKGIILLFHVKLDCDPVYQDELLRKPKTKKYKLLFITCKQTHVLWSKTLQEYLQWKEQLKKCCILTNYSAIYSNLKFIGKGNFAKVFIARNRENKESYAVKITDKAQRTAKGKNSQMTLYNEIEILRRCDHPNIIKLYEVFEGKTHIYMVQNYVKGGELYEAIMTRGRFSEKQAAKILHQILLALDYLHGKGIMHRDLKPENVILKDEELNIVVIDFGLASFVSDDVIYKKCGTPGYIAPEILNDLRYDTKIDIFSAGVIFYILLTGFSPFFGRQQEEIIRKNKACQINFNFQEMRVPITREAQELLAKMLLIDSIKRIDAKSALTSPFMLRYFPSHNMPLISINSEEDLGMDEHNSQPLNQNVPTLQKYEFTVAQNKMAEANFLSPAGIRSPNAASSKRALQKTPAKDPARTPLRTPKSTVLTMSNQLRSPSKLPKPSNSRIANFQQLEASHASKSKANLQIKILMAPPSPGADGNSEYLQKLYLNKIQQNNSQQLKNAMSTGNITEDSMTPIAQFVPQHLNLPKHIQQINQRQQPLQNRTPKTQQKEIIKVSNIRTILKNIF